MQYFAAKANDTLEWHGWIDGLGIAVTKAEDRAVLIMAYPPWNWRDIRLSA